MTADLPPVGEDADVRAVLAEFTRWQDVLVALIASGMVVLPLLVFDLLLWSVGRS